jgi:glycosyltransferase involved in cell wall biosynthesis
MRSSAPSDESARPAISVVVPAFNEEHRIAPTLVALEHHLAAIGASHEIVVVDDGSTDGTVELVRKLAEARPVLRVLATSPNRGKGHAVRVGMLAARGRVRVMIDADGSIPPDELGALLAPIRAGQADVVIGSRYADGARVATPQPGWRRAWSRLVNRIVQRSLVPGVLDTQCGFKAFTDAAAEAVFRRCRIDGWAFDLEALAIAHRLGLVTREVGVAWQDDPRSRVRPLHDLARVVREWLTIRANLRRGAYGPLPALARA